MASGTAAAATGGFTTVCAMANTNPTVDTVEVLMEVLAEAARASPVRVRQLAAVTYGLRGEEMTDLDALAAAGAIAFSDDGKPVWNADVMRQALQVGARLERPICGHEEEPTIVRDGVAHAGSHAARLGLAGWPCEGETAMVARDLVLLEEGGGHLHVCHVSCAETVPLLAGAKDRGLHVTAEVTPHHLALSDRLLLGDEDLGLAPGHPHTKVNPPLRSEEDANALVKALQAGIIDAIATDHAPHSAEDKESPYERAAFGISGIETALPLVLSLVRAGRLDITTAIERLTAGPARVFGVETGALRPGAVADVCVFDPNRQWTVSQETLRSKGKNTPLIGATVTGRVTYTIVGGEVIHRGD